MSYTLPTQGFVAHGISLMTSPWHGLPPCCVGGLLQAREYVCVPPPHVAVHGLRGNQEPQPPSIGSKKNWNLLEILQGGDALTEFIPDQKKVRGDDKDGGDVAYMAKRYLFSLITNNLFQS